MRYKCKAEAPPQVISTLNHSSTMEEKKKKEKAISNSGGQIFDGLLTLRIGKKEYKVHTEYFGLDMQHASQEHQIIVLLKQHLPYDEIDTGWLVRAKDLDKDHRFGLKARKSDRWFAVYDYNDVVAWGYADGGLNSDHWNSCRMRPEDYPQFAGDPQEDEEEEFDDIERRGVVFKVEDGEIHYNAIVADDEKMTNHATDLMRDAGKTFYDFREKHPEVTEMHFYTDDEVKIKE